MVYSEEHLVSHEESRSSKRAPGHCFLGVDAESMLDRVLAPEFCESPRIETGFVEQPRQDLLLREVEAFDPERRVDNFVETLEDPLLLGRNRRAHQHQGVDGEVRVHVEGRFLGFRRPTHRQAAVAPLGFHGLFRWRAVASGLEDPAQQHGSVEDLDTHAFPQFQQSPVCEVAVGTSVIEEELDGRGHEANSNRGDSEGLPAEGSSPKLLPEKPEHLIKGVAGGVAGLVDEFRRHDGVSASWKAMGIARTGIDLDSLKAASEFTPKTVEAFGRHHRITREAKAQYAAAGPGSLPDVFECFIRDVQRFSMSSRHREWQGGLGENRGHHALVHHQCEGEIARQAHSDRTHAGPATFAVGMATESSKPIRNGTRLSLGQDGELAAHAGPKHLACDDPVRQRSARRTEEVGQVHAKPIICHDAGEAGDLWGDPRYFVHHDHAWTIAALIDGPLRSFVGEQRVGEAFEGSDGHRRCSCSVSLLRKTTGTLAASLYPTPPASRRTREARMELGLAGKVALITGSYRGTGAGIAASLAEEGATVLVHGFEPGQPEPVVEKLRAQGHDARPLVGGLLDDESAQALAQEALEVAGHIDILVNNYGVAERGRWFEDSTEAWLSIYQKNVLSGVRLVRACVPGMRERGWGRVIWLGTIGALRPNSRMPHYYASKATLPTVCVSLAKELSGTGITVNLVSPGLIATTEVKEQMARRAEKNEGERSWASGLLDNPIGRMAEVEEVASLVTYLASERAGAIHGTNVRIDGGSSDCAIA